MNATLIWLLVAIGNGVHSSPAPIARFTTEAACQAAADQLWERSRLRAQTPKHYTSTVDAVCIPAQGVAQ